MKTIAEIVKQEREKRGWSTYDLAEKSGVSQPTIYRLENEVCPNTRKTTITKLAKTFNISEAELLGYTTPDNQITTNDSIFSDNTNEAHSIEHEIFRILEITKRTIKSQNRPFCDDQVKDLYILALRVGLKGTLSEEQLGAMAEYIYSR